MSPFVHPGICAAVIACTLFFPSLLTSETIAFTTSEGTWVSLDLAPDGRRLVLELLGDGYTLPVNGGSAEPLIAGRAFQSQPRFSSDGSQVVYISDGTGSDNVWLAGADGRNQRA